MSNEMDNSPDYLHQPVTRRQVLKGAAVVGGAFALGPVISACGGDGGAGSESSPTGAASGTPKKGGSLRIGIVGVSAKDTLDGQVPASEPSNCFTYQLYDALLGYDADYNMVNLLAESVESNATGDVWTVRLRPDVVFHNGKTMTSEDVVYSYKRILDPDSPGNGQAALKVVLEANGIRALDESTVEFSLLTPYAIFKDQLAYYCNCILPVDFDPAKPIGTGPFKLRANYPGEQVVFDANRDYWGDGPYADELTVVGFADPSARVNALLGGTVEAITQLPREQITVVDGSGNAKALIAHTGGMQPFTMAIDMKPFDDVRVRQAFRLIADREEMLSQAYNDLGWVGNDMYSPLDPGYPKDLPQREQDLEQAKSLLKQAGYGDGLVVTLDTSDAVGGGAVAAAQVFAEQAKGAGATVKVNKIADAEYWGEGFLHYAFGQTFYYTRGYLAQASLITMPGAVWNETHWKHDKWLAIVDEAFKTADEQKRNELIAEAETIEYEEGGYIVWSFNDQVDAYSTALGGVVPYRNGVPLSGFQFKDFYFA